MRPEASLSLESADNTVTYLQSSRTHSTGSADENDAHVPARLAVVDIPVLRLRRAAHPLLEVDHHPTQGPLSHGGLFGSRADRSTDGRRLQVGDQTVLAGWCRRVGDGESGE